MKVPYFALVASVGLIAPATAFAQAPQAAASSALVVGAMTYDPQGGEVGKIESISNDAIVINTGASKAALPKSAFGTNAKGPMVTMTKAQIDEQVAASAQKSAAALEAAMVVGAEVKGKAGTLVGTIKEVKPDLIVIARTAGPVSLTKKAFGLGAQGLFISLTAAELDAAAKQAKPSA